MSRHRGVQTLEQRLSAGSTTQPSCKLRNMTEKEGTAVMGKNTSETLKPRKGFANLFLLALHVGVLVISLWVHPLNLAPADRALPYTETGA